MMCEPCRNSSPASTSLSSGTAVQRKVAKHGEIPRDRASEFILKHIEMSLRQLYFCLVRMLSSGHAGPCNMFLNLSTQANWTGF